MASGSEDPVLVGIYSSTKGLLEKVRYHAGMAYDDAEYFYDELARLEKIEDWLGGNGLRYAYDAAGRMTTLTDYDDSTLEYEYDAAGNVESMTDYHNNETTYVYDDAGRLTSMTAPGSKTWTFAYNALNQPTVETLPNGMATFYTYDTRNRLEMIDHKDAAVSGTTQLSFDYTLDDDGNIERIDENDGGFWEYDYDGRNRLVDAVYTTPAGHEAVYGYTYDDGDNMTQKVEPFQDDFNDGNLTGWSTIQTWSAASGAARNTVNGSAHSYIHKATTDADNEVRFDYINHDTSNNAYGLTVIPRINGNDHQLFVNFFPDRMQVQEKVSGSWSTLVNNTSVTTAEDVVYTVRVVAAGTNLKVYRAEAGGMEEQLCSVTVTGTTVTNVYLQARISSDISFDNVRILADDLASTWTMTSNDANELTQMQNSAQGSTYTYTYDAMGRTTEKALGGKTADYTWRYDSKLHTVTSDHFDEGNVTYDYGADGKLRSRTHNSVTTSYNWAGWNVINEETGAGALAMTYYHKQKTYRSTVLAAVQGSTPATDPPVYLMHDHLGSTRTVVAQTASLLFSFEYEPFGTLLNPPPSSFSYPLFTGHKWDAATKLFFAPFRFYSPRIGKWGSRDPKGMRDGPNSRGYVKNNPVNLIDPLGLQSCWQNGQPIPCPDDQINDPCREYKECGSYDSCVACCLLRCEDDKDCANYCATSCLAENPPPLDPELPAPTPTPIPTPNPGPKSNPLCSSTPEEDDLWGDMIFMLILFMLLYLWSGRKTWGITRNRPISPNRLFLVGFAFHLVSASMDSRAVESVQLYGLRGAAGKSLRGSAVRAGKHYVWTLDLNSMNVDILDESFNSMRLIEGASSDDIVWIEIEGTKEANFKVSHIGYSISSKEKRSLSVLDYDNVKEKPFDLYKVYGPSANTLTLRSPAENGNSWEYFLWNYNDDVSPLSASKILRTTMQERNMDLFRVSQVFGREAQLFALAEYDATLNTTVSIVDINTLEIIQKFEPIPHVIRMTKLGPIILLESTQRPFYWMLEDDGKSGNPQFKLASYLSSATTQGKPLAVLSQGVLFHKSDPEGPKPGVYFLPYTNGVAEFLNSVFVYSEKVPVRESASVAQEDWAVLIHADRLSTLRVITIDNEIEVSKYTAVWKNGKISFIGE